MEKVQGEPVVARVVLEGGAHHSVIVNARAGSSRDDLAIMVTDAIRRIMNCETVPLAAMSLCMPSGSVPIQL